MTCYSNLQMAAALRQAGVNAGAAVFLVATAHPESGGCGVMQQGQPYATTGWGPWQITPGNSEPQCGVNGQLFGLQAAACAAAAKLKSQGLGAWTTITNGLNSPFMSGAQSAVSQAYRMSPGQVSSLVGSAGKGGISTTSFNPLGAAGNILSGNILGGLASSLGLPSPKDLMVRFGLILLGGLVLIVGIFMLVGKQSATAALTAVAPESEAVGASRIASSRPARSPQDEARASAREGRSERSLRVSESREQRALRREQKENASQS